MSESGMALPGGSILENMDLKSYDIIRQSTRERMITQGLSRESSRALRRGETTIERQAAWPFDIYQATGLMKIDYHYWHAPVSTSCGDSKLVSMHAVGYTGSGEPVAADQVYHKAALAEAHTLSMKQFLREQKQGYANAALPKNDWWEKFKTSMIKGANPYEAAPQPNVQQAAPV